jgi:hypothetical protein
MSHKTAGIWCTVVLLLGLAAAHAEDNLFSDNFAGKDGQRPASWKYDTTDPDFWKIANGWLATGNGDNLVVATDGYSYAVIDTPGCDKWEDYRISCKFWAKQKNGSIGLVGRWKDRLNFYRVDLDCAEGNTILKLVKVVKGATTVLATEALDLTALEMPPVAEGSAEKPTLFSLSFEGNIVSVQMNGRQMLRHTDLAFTAGTAGLAERADDVLFGDVKVAAATPGAGLPQLAATAPAPASAPTGPEFSVLLSSDKDMAASSALVRTLRMRGFQPFIVQDADKQKVYVGRFASRQDATRLQAEMVVEGFSFASVRQLTETELAGRPSEPTPATVAAVPTTVLKEVGWDEMSPMQQQKIMDTLMKSRASRMNLQSVDEVLALKQMVEQLSEKQKEILSTMQSALDTDENTKRTTRQLVEKINRAMDGRAWTEAEDLLNQLEKIQPDHPLIGIKRAMIKNRKENTFEGQEILTESLQKEITDLKGRAKAAEDKQDLRAAYNLWTAVLTKNPSDKAAVDEATQKIQSIKEALDAQEHQRQADLTATAKKSEKFFYTAGGAVAVLLIVALALVYVSGRRRYARMLQQMHEEAIAPLQELRERTRGIGTAAPGGLGYERQQGLLGETESSRSEFMIPETPAPEPPRSAPTSRGGASAPSVQATPAGESDNFMMDFDGASNKGSVKPVEAAPKPEEDLVFSFDSPSFNAPAGEQTGPAITAAEVPDATAKGNDEIVFSFSDNPLDTAHDKTAPGAGTSSGSADSVYESISLDDLNIDFDVAKPEPAENKATAPGLGDLDFRIGPPADDQSATLELPGGNPLTAGLDFGQADGGPGALEESGTAVLDQKYTDEPFGAMPQGWTGENTDYASLQVAEDPAESDRKCLQFRKTEGRAPTTFSCRFPDVNGRVRVDFDLRCDEKNKHLLGLYIEADNDFRRSVHTVVQCTDPDRPAHLRVFTRPTPYTLGSWRHIRYTIDLNEGLVDGYVDDELVAEGVRMGTKTPILNTLSLRDNSETTGTLYIRNLVVAQL